MSQKPYNDPRRPRVARAQTQSDSISELESVNVESDSESELESKFRLAHIVVTDPPPSRDGPRIVVEMSPHTHASQEMHANIPNTAQTLRSARHTLQVPFL